MMEQVLIFFKIELITAADLDYNAVATSQIQPGNPETYLVTDKSGEVNWIPYPSGGGGGTSLDYATLTQSFTCNT